MENGENLYNIVFKSNENKDVAERLDDLHTNKDEMCRYFQKLSTLGLSTLSKELNRIDEERTSIINQTQELAFQEYPTFIETAQCTQDIFQSFQKVNQSTEKMTSNLSVLKEKCAEFSQTAQALNSARRLTSLALSRHTQLLEILELPQLMDTCVRNGYWEEALDLAAYVARLERKLGYIPLIVKVAQEVQSCTRLMLSQLIAQLRMPAQLPHCLKVVGYLRRMGVFSEEEIRLKFLQARDAWFKSTLEEIPKEDAYQHVLKTVELSRVHLFDIATQYRAIFTDEDPLVLANQDPNTNESALFHSWVIQKVTDFVTTLQNDLPRVSPSSLESVFGQCMYFGLSFGRIGSDFRALLIPLFAQVAYDRFAQAANKAEAQFADAMASFSLSTRSSGAPASSSFQIQGGSADQIHPPYSLIKFPPLAELCNALISAFNELRLCAPVQLVDPVSRKVERTLQACSGILADFQRQEKEAFTSAEEQEFSRCLQLYQQDLLPHIQKMLQLLFPPSVLSTQTGFPTTDISKQKPGLLDKDLILKPIVHLIVVNDQHEIVPDPIPAPIEIVEHTESTEDRVLEEAAVQEKSDPVPSDDIPEVETLDPPSESIVPPVETSAESAVLPTEISNPSAESAALPTETLDPPEESTDIDQSNALESTNHENGGKQEEEEEEKAEEPITNAEQ